MDIEVCIYLMSPYLCIVHDADGEIVRCRWAESAQRECGGVCQVFPAVLDQVCLSLLMLGLMGRAQLKEMAVGCHSEIVYYNAVCWP